MVRWGVREGEWVQVSNYNVCMTRRCLGGRSVLCAVEGWVGDCGGGVEISSYWLEESRCVVLVGRLIWDFVSICKRNGLCERRRGKRRVWPWDIVRMNVVLLTELCWRRNSTGWVDDFPLGRERRFVVRRVKTGGR